MLRFFNPDLGSAQLGAQLKARTGAWVKAWFEVNKCLTPKKNKIMSKNVAGILGNQYGKIGPVVARKFRGKNVYSKYQPNVNNPRTNAQMIQRARFKALSELAHRFACGARVGFVAAAKGSDRSPRNLFQHLNFSCITATNPQALIVDYTTIKVAKGSLSEVGFGAPGFDTPSKVEVDWENISVPCQTTINDKVYIVIHCPDAKATIVSEPVARTAGTVSVAVPVNWNGMKVHVYGFVRNDGPANTEFGIPAGECSESTYIGFGNIG